MRSAHRADALSWQSLPNQDAMGSAESGGSSGRPSSRARRSHEWRGRTRSTRIKCFAGASSIARACSKLSPRSPHPNGCRCASPTSRLRRRARIRQLRRAESTSNWREGGCASKVPPIRRPCAFSSSCCGHDGEQYADLVDRRRHLYAARLSRTLGHRARETRARSLLGSSICFSRPPRGDLIKVLWWDGDGLCLFSKRLERGRFVWPQASDGVVLLTRAQLSMLLEGIDWRRPERTTEKEHPGPRFAV